MPLNIDEFAPEPKHQRDAAKQRRGSEDNHPNNGNSRNTNHRHLRSTAENYPKSPKDRKAKHDAWNS